MGTGGPVVGGGLTMCTGVWIADKVKSSVQCDNGATAPV